ncbi:metal-dependent transcriptional regulator [Aliifodinibius sp. S!AR15-10]|uniref:metal-dependent transcriptional regulator n=1 Tax=Aliifodinibius sp. S!AR15-10 TaxID=2950437 RepID=UPI00285C386E|nr:metal-dependent transcriptional regulator [Aliifodinibius sp. S!AR15-10]MDR8391189.1 metal-dependent transcriptional regulator [Aliifodinibius sp. S!AR15-10]
MVLSQAVEDYLKTIYILESEGSGATTSSIAESLDVSSASATNMVKRLSKMGLVDYQSYKGATLTNSGRKIALEIIRHHRLLELYLLEVMGYSWDEVHDEAEKLEHHISEQFEDKIAELLDNPTHDPHGDPIPTKEGVMPELDAEPLGHAKADKIYIVSRVKDQDPEVLRYLEKIGMLPGVKVEVKDKAPFNGPITILLEDTEQAIGYEIANKIFVAEMPG